MLVMLCTGTEKVKVLPVIPERTARSTQPDRVRVVVNCTLPDVAPDGMVSDAGIRKALLVASRVMTVGDAAGTPSVKPQLPEIPGVSVTGVQDSDKGLLTGVTIQR